MLALLKVSAKISFATDTVQLVLLQSGARQLSTLFAMPFRPLLPAVMQSAEKCENLMAVTYMIHHREDVSREETKREKRERSRHLIVAGGKEAK
jgi:hypothetical protein